MKGYLIKGKRHHNGLLGPKDDLNIVFDEPKRLQLHGNFS